MLFLLRSFNCAWGVLLALLLASSSMAATASDVPPEIVDALKSLKTASTTARQAVYDLIAKQGNARLIPALKAYRDGTLQLSDNRLIIYGSRTDVPGKGSVLPMLDAITGAAIIGPDAQPLYSAKIDLSNAIKSPPFRERRTINDLVSALSLND